MNTPERRAAFIAALRRLADAMERNQDVPLPYSASMTLSLPASEQETPELLAGIVASIGGADWAQEIAEGTGGVPYLYVSSDLGGGFRVRVMARADKVTEAVQTGVAPVYERRTPALDAVIAKAREGGTS